MVFKIEDTRVKAKLAFANAKLGDIVIDHDDDMYIIVKDEDEGFTLLDLTLGYYSLGASYCDIESLLQYYDEFADGIKEVIPSEKVSLKL